MKIFHFDSCPIVVSVKTMKRCKSCGRSLRNEDMISQLPEALLLQILSLLPTEKVVATSVLSKRWRTLWKVVPKLKFRFYGLTDLQTFSDNVARILLSHQAPVLQSLHLVVIFDQGTSMDLGVLLGIAFGLHVRELILEVYCEEGLFTFPRSLYSCEKLETLQLVTSCGEILLDVPSPVCLKSLRTLHLHQVGYKDDESVC
uniref:F-box/FBD/LRR-repeat protein n=1 Tax=Noccaea caerulescens TaxID=107243 RepID=A0A1J3JNP8_NOCCA